MALRNQILTLPAASTIFNYGRSFISLPQTISDFNADARWGEPSQDSFVPRMAKRELSGLQHTSSGGFVLEPGYFSFDGQSYCLHAGTHGPGQGDNYLDGLPLGAAKDAVITIAPTGRWSHHPDGYWIRDLPNSYSNTVVEIWVPTDSPDIGKEYDPATYIAVPGNTSRQRLIQSGRAYAHSKASRSSA